MNLNERELVQHVEFETETYYASFSAEFEISCSPLWRLLLHCTSEQSKLQLVRSHPHLLRTVVVSACLYPSVSPLQVSVLAKIMQALDTWLDMAGFGDVQSRADEYQVSFHIPLHR